MTTYLDSDNEVLMREGRTSPTAAACINAPQVLDDLKATILAGRLEGAIPGISLNMLCDDGFTRGFVLPGSDKEKLTKLVQALPDFLSRTRATRYAFVMYGGERLLIGAADIMGGKCCGCFDGVGHDPAGGITLGEWRTLEIEDAPMGLLDLFGSKPAVIN